MSSIVDLCDAVADELNTGEFSIAFTAQSLVLPVYELKQLQGFRVSVIPHTFARERQTRTSVSETHEVLIAMQKEIDGDQVRDYIGLGAEVIEFLQDRPLAAFPTARNTGLTFDPIFDRASLDTFTVANIGIVATYEVARNI